MRVITARMKSAPLREVIDGVEITRIAAGSGGRWQRMGTFLLGLVATVVPLGRVSDVIQVQQILYPAAVVAVAGGVLRRPVVARNTGSGRFGGVTLMRSLPFGTLALSLVARSCTAVSLNAEMTAEMRAAGFRRIVAIPNGVDIPPEVTPGSRREARERLRVDGPVAVYIGRLDVEKAPHVVVHAWRAVRAAGATLLVVGDGPARSELEALAASLGERSVSIRFCGPTDEPGLYLRAADILVLPSASEGLSNVLLEAMAHAVPVIASDVAGNREVIERPDLGVLVAPGDAIAFASAIDRWLADPAAASLSGRAAREHVAARYALGSMVTAYEQLYAGLAGRR